MNLKTWMVGFLAAGMALVSANPAWASNALQNAIIQAGLNMNEVRSVTTFYYQNPQPEKMVAVLKTLVTVHEFTSDNNHFPPIAHLISTAAYNDKDLLEKMAVLKGGLSGEAQAIVDKMIEEAEHFKSPEADSLQHLDFLWSEFFATGNAEPVKKIIGALNASQSADSKVISASAQWSLASNVKQHKKVYDIVKTQSSQATGALKNILEQMLKDAG